MSKYNVAIVQPWRLGDVKVNALIVDRDVEKKKTKLTKYYREQKLVCLQENSMNIIS